MVAEAEFGAEVVIVDVGSEARPGFSASPTVLVDGEDLFPDTRADAASCRLYETPEGLKSAPTGSMLRMAMKQREGVRTAAP